MDQRRLQELLTALHAELLAAGPVDAKNRDLLRHLESDIRARLGASDAARYQGLSGSLREAATAFEASHPRLTGAMEKVIDTLALYNL